MILKKINFEFKYVFYLYLIVVMFGTQLPFSDRIESWEEIETSNVVNQLLFSSFYLISLFKILHGRHRVIRVLKREKALSIYLVWCFVSILWSPYVLISFKRCIQLIGNMCVLFLAVLEDVKDESILRFLRFLSYIFILFNLLAVIIFPGAIDIAFDDAWRGIANQKNYLGQQALICCVIIGYFLSKKENKRKWIDVCMIAVGIVLLIGSKSTSAILAALSLCTFVCIYIISKNVFIPRIGKRLAAVFIIFVSAITALLIFNYPVLLTEILELSGKDSTMTGRTELWSFILNQSKSHIISGIGYGGYYVVPSAMMEKLFDEFVWMPNTAHNGYLDILNETGIIGLFLMIMVILNYFMNLKNNINNVWSQIAIAVIVINISETVFKPHVIGWELFCLGYLMLFWNIERESEQISQGS